MGIANRSKGRQGTSVSADRSWDGAWEPAAGGAALAAAAPVPGAAERSGKQAVHKPLYLCQPFVRSTLIKGSFRTIVALPKYVNPYEWIAINRACDVADAVFDFFHHLNQFCEVVSEFCTPSAEPTMCAGVGLHYTWVDVHRKPIPLPAPQYIDFVMTWIGQVLADEAVFPTKPGT